MWWTEWWNGELVAAVEMERQFGMEGSFWSPLGGVVLVMVPCRQPGSSSALTTFPPTHSPALFLVPSIRTKTGIARSQNDLRWKSHPERLGWYDL